ncbi:uncharacterized protein C3orf20 homolog isoform X2 [Protopterus annectens]|nr:uncharacterized protein C3orf20 homolog isoform X2 [Protopterus annectens]
MSAFLCTPGPLYFYDQPKGATQITKRTRKVIEGLPLEFRYLSVNPRVTAAVSSLGKHKKLTSERVSVEGAEDTSKNGATTKVKNVTAPGVTLTSSLLQNEEEGAIEDQPKPLEALFAVPPDEDIHMTPFEEYKCAAPALLNDVHAVLEQFADSSGIFPQGLKSVLNCGWAELIQGADNAKKPVNSQSCKSTKHHRASVSVDSDKLLALTDGIVEQSTKGKSKNKRRVTLVDNLADKGRQDQDNTQSKPSGTTGSTKEKAPLPQSQVSYLPYTINFSISRTREENDWIIQQEGASLDDPEWKAVCSWVVERLRVARIQIKDQESKLKQEGFDKPLILRHYEDARKEIHSKYKKQALKVPPPVLISGKPRIPEIKQEDVSLPKLHYSLPDGSSLIHYRSGQLAVCQSHSGLPCGGFYTNVFGDLPEQSILATFTPFLYGTVNFPKSNILALMFDQEGGVMFDEDGNIIREWKWQLTGKFTEPVIMQVNEFITLRIAGQFAMSLTYKCHHERVRLSVSPIADVSSQSIEMGQILSDQKFSSKAARELTKENLKKINEKEAKKKFFMKKNESAKFLDQKSELMKSLPDFPEDDAYHITDLETSSVLRKIRIKINNIIDDWMEHYRIATGIGSSHIRSMSISPTSLVKRKIQSAVAHAVSPVAEEEKDEDAMCTATPPNFKDHILLHRFQSAPPRNSQWDPPRSSRSLRVLSSRSYGIKQDQLHISESSKTKHTVEPGRPLKSGTFVTESAVEPKTAFPVRSGNENDKPWLSCYNSCPVALRLAMLGKEKRRCRCSSHQIPHLTDLEYDNFISSQMPGLEQIIVVCVVSSTGPEAGLREEELQQLYAKKNKNRSMPCMQSRLDSFRLLKYDIATADEHTGQKGSLLVRRHNVAPGMFLMYIQGKLLFADYIFNGYSKSVKDLQKQIAKTRGDYCMGHCLPSNFRFSPPSTVSKDCFPACTSRTENEVLGCCEHLPYCQSRGTLQVKEGLNHTNGRCTSVQDFLISAVSKRSIPPCEIHKKSSQSPLKLETLFTNSISTPDELRV